MSDKELTKSFKLIDESSGECWLVTEHGWCHVIPFPVKKNEGNRAEKDDQWFFKIGDDNE